MEGKAEPISPDLWPAQSSLVQDYTEETTLTQVIVSATPSVHLQLPVLRFNRSGPGALVLVTEDPSTGVAINLYAGTLQNFDDPC